MEEIEVKFLDINVSEIEKKLRSLGAQKMFDKLYKRKVFDFPDFRLNKQGAWIRLRDEGEQITLTYKQRIGMNTTKAGDQGMEEIEIIVDDFAKTEEILLHSGFILKFYQENKRTRYQLDFLTFDIDTWPLLNPYLEIEGETWEDVDRGIELLGLDPEEKKICSPHQVYTMKGLNDFDYIEMKFSGSVLRKTKIT